MQLTLKHGGPRSEAARASDPAIQLQAIDDEVVRLERLVASHRLAISERQSTGERYANATRTADAAKLGRLRSRLDDLQAKQDKFRRAIRQAKLDRVAPQILKEQKTMRQICSDSAPEAVAVCRKFADAFAALVRLGKLENQHERRVGSASRAIAHALTVDQNYSPPSAVGCEFPASSNDLRRMMIECLQSGVRPPRVEDFSGLMDRGFLQEEFDNEGMPPPVVFGEEEEDDATAEPVSDDGLDLAEAHGMYDEYSGEEDDEGEEE